MNSANQPKTLFISDLHLDESQPAIIELFFRFLKEEATQADALYILGDFFEVWIGDDEQTPLQKQVATALKTLATQRSVKIYFMHGNRDFLLGKRFAKQAKIQLLNDPTVINLYGRKALLMHGDTLCTADEAYQAFRKKVRKKWLQKIFFCLPLSLRKKIANKMRQGSSQHTNNTAAYLMDVNQDEVKRVMKEEQIDFLIHGHTHRPAIHSNQQTTRVVLGAWHHQSSVFEYRQDHHFKLR
jgi:UDP-2,3-diacylglucosamine hydrolase